MHPQLRSALEARYERRRLEGPLAGNRTAFTVAVAGAILLALVGSFLAAMHAKPDPRAYLASRSRVVALGYEDLAFAATPVAAKSCAAPETCRDQALAAGTEPRRFDDVASLANPHTESKGLVLLRFDLTRAALGDLADYLTLSLSLPGFRYYRADLFLDGVRQRSFFLARPLVTVFEPAPLRDRPMQVDLLLELNPAQPALWDARTREPVVVATQFEYETFQEHLAAERAGKGRWLSTVSVVVLAIFVLLLFLIIDGSPESLGLALAMGFEAFNLALRNRWLPVDLGSRLDIGVSAWLFQMSLVLKVYFCAQLARLANKSIRPWFVWGGLVALAVAASRYAAATRITDAATQALWNWVDVAFSAAGLAVTALGLVVVARRRMPWRTLALACAALAMLMQGVGAAYPLLPRALQSDAAAVLAATLASNVPYLLALGAFVNISTLENRVRSLSAAHARARELEHDMELGRTVQQSLHVLPSLPPELPFTAHFDALAYVSGDTYFVDWHAPSGRFTVVLNDVTGHGIQAALKAAACNSMAGVLWRAGDAARAGGAAEAFDRYFGMVQAYLDRHGEVADQAAIAAVELDTRRGALTCYRANYLSPVLVEPDAGGGWRHAPVPLGHRKATTRPLPPGAFVLLLSDGFLANAAADRSFQRGLRQALSGADAGLTADGLRELILALPCFRDQRKLDDRTLLIFQWRPLRQAPYSSASIT